MAAPSSRVDEEGAFYQTATQRERLLSSRPARCRYRTRNTVSRPAKVSETAIPSESGSPSLHRVASGWDRRHEPGVERLFAMVNDLVVICSRSGEVLLVNPAWTETNSEG